MSLVIRPAVSSDAEMIFRFVSGLIDDHLPGQTPWTSAERIEADGFGPDPLFEALIAEREGKSVGFVSFCRGYAGWRGKPMGIVHALYVMPEERRTGAAKALMAAAARIALDRGWLRVELFVEEGRSAIRFYEAIGMSDLHHRHMRLEGEALIRLANNTL
ncbi:GNAT family N-acetyltransferase [Microvirga arabica]|uniref:GNAT family N-acetyltransferase n=1 Tax=Microvirga arabica TaxID=1128671 RepID=A0ABV6Y8L7_9HYPH